MTREIHFRASPGLGMVFLVLGVGLASAYGLYQGASSQNTTLLLLVVPVWLLILFTLPGFFVVNPNDAKVLTLLGKYVGTVKAPGLWWANPFMVKKRISLKIRNFETTKLKVNDSHSNPIEIAAIVVWKVVDTAAAMFEVDDYENYVKVQSESAVRSLASAYPYDAHKEGDVALSTNPTEVSKDLQIHVDERLSKAGVEVLDTRISHLAYSPEIAFAMLQRQQASAIIAARTKIVEGAVSMVEMAIQQLSQRNIIDLDAERKATMVSNLLVVLCSERATQPVVNTGTLYQ